MNFAKNFLKTMINENEVRFAMQRHETTFLVNYEPLKRWEDIVTTIQNLCVDTIRTCFNDGNAHQKEEFWRFKIT